MVKTEIVKNTPKGSALLWNPRWVYVPSCKTDILERFKSMNWTPPSRKEQS